MDRSPLFIQSLEKALFVLEAFREAEQFLSLADISRISGLAKPAAQRCVHTLVQTGYMEKDVQSGRFSLARRYLISASISCCSPNGDCRDSGSVEASPRLREAHQSQPVRRNLCGLRDPAAR